MDTTVHLFLVNIVDMSVYHNMLTSVGSVAPGMAHQENRRDLAYYDART
jgi:hypothetical protein